MINLLGLGKGLTSVSCKMLVCYGILNNILSVKDSFGYIAATHVRFFEISDVVGLCRPTEVQSQLEKQMQL
jgi:hypothetical protein